MFFMLTEPKTTPILKKGKIIYGILTAIFTFLILIFIPQYEESLAALVVANILVPIINKITIRKK